MSHASPKILASQIPLKNQSIPTTALRNSPRHSYQMRFQQGMAIEYAQAMVFRIKIPTFALNGIPKLS